MFPCDSSSPSLYLHQIRQPLSGDQADYTSKLNQRLPRQALRHNYAIPGHVIRHNSVMMQAVAFEIQNERASASLQSKVARYLFLCLKVPRYVKKLLISR